MTQSIPSTMFYSQAVALLTQLNTSYVSGALKSPSDIAKALNSVLTQFDQTVGQPILDFDFFEDGEPPITPKINQIWGDIQLDTTILGNQVDLLNASTLFTNNLIATQLLNLANENAAIGNKLDTLELFSTNNTSSNLITFSDSFANSQLIDTNFVDQDPQASVMDGVLTISAQGDFVDVGAGSQVSILSSSNGFLGNNQEIENITQPLRFVAEDYQANSLPALLDNVATTWVEYESYLVSNSDKATAENFNFQYQVIPSTTDTSGQITYQDWSIGPPDGVLEFDLQFDLGTIQLINRVVYTPFGLDNNVNNPVLVTEMRSSSDGVNWTPITPANVWVGTNTSQSSLRSTTNYTIGDVVWNFANTSARYIQVFTQQPNPITVNIGHLYYTNSANQRVAGPIPSTNDLAQYYNESYVSVGSLTQNREYFIGQRWAIGVQEVAIQQVNYQTTSSMVTKELAVPGVVNRVALDADVWVPPSFDPSVAWVNFYVSPDNGQTWFHINNIEDNSLGYPEIIAFNDPLPTAFQDPNVTYYNVAGTVNTLRFKIELISANNEETPLVRSYTLKVTTR